jgi:hypothetical protein
MIMLENYSKNADGLIYQIEKEPFTYDKNYVKERYDTYGELNGYMSHLRLGYIFGTIKEKILSVLDVGYGNGSFLKTCKKIIPTCYGFDVTGYEVPKDCIFVEDWKKLEVDVITFFDVLEHFDTPYIIKDLKAKHIVLSFPWCHYKSDVWFKNWKHRRPNEHLWFFDDKNIFNFAESTGYEVINLGNVEDTIRGLSENSENILSVILKKK